MYNISTEKAIRSIPSIAGVDIDRLPQLLSEKYARIIGLKTLYDDGEIQFNNEELKRDLDELGTIANTLELYLVADKSISEKNTESIAFVSAVARKLMSMIRKAGSLNELSLYYVPEDLLSAILYTISGNLPDAQEVADHFDLSDVSCIGKKAFISSIQWMLRGKLEAVININPVALDFGTDVFDYASQLIWRELLSGIQHVCDSLLNGTPYSNEEFEIIERLSSESLEYEHYKDVFDGTIILSKLLKLAATQLFSHSLIAIQSPNSVEPGKWAIARRQLASNRPFLWDNHIEGINKGILEPGVSSIVTFPTGAGKTSLTELKIVSTLLSGGRVIYLVPTHALEHQVNCSLNQLVNSIEPVSTNVDGEYTFIDEEDESRQIMVMTPEHCLTILKTAPQRISNVRLVVFDEFHLIHGNATDYRAVDAMILLSSLLDVISEADFCLVSAMVQNGHEIADWIQCRTGRQCIVLDNPWKPTSQLQGCLLYNKTIIDDLQTLIRNTRNQRRDCTSPPVSLKNKMLAQPQCLFSLKAVWDTMDAADYYLTNILSYPVKLSVNSTDDGRWYLSSNFNEVAANLAARFTKIGLKTIVFALNPSYAHSICKSINKLIGQDKRALMDTWNEDKSRLTLELGSFEYSYLSFCTSSTLHNSHLLPEERILSERYFKHKDGAPVMVATPTIAQGINLPADIVLIAGSSRYDKQRQGQQRIEAHEILNAAGRAGRAGFRSHGTAILIPSNIIKMENNRITNIWTELREEVFSKGDRCLVVHDPIEDILNMPNLEINPIVNKFQGDRDFVEHHLRNSFYAYQMHNNGAQDRCNDLILRFVDYISNNSEATPHSIIAGKTGLNIQAIDYLFDSILNLCIEQIVSWSISDLLEYMKSIMIPCDIFSLMFSNNYSEDQAKKIVGLDNNIWTKEGIARLFDLVKLYINGGTLFEIESKCNCKRKEYVDNARVFVLRVIPEISYMCGVFVQVIVAKIDELKLEIDLPNDFKVFASCIKEGVISYDMLNAKYKNRWMRVECHNKYHYANN